MSAGAVFKLIANDGKADRMIMATALLNQRIKDVMCARSRAGKADTTPTLVDLERTHILYVNAHFKPFAAIGCEYNKVKPSTGGSTTLGTTGITFSIPQFGDFFYDMVARVRIESVRANGGTTPVQAAAGGIGATTWGTNFFPLNGNAVTPVNPAGNPALYNITDAAGNVLVSGVAQAPPAGVAFNNFVQYCEYPGNRLFSSVSFQVNGNPLDQYSALVPVMLEKFCTPPNKRVGHDRLVGQEVPLTGYGGLRYATVNDADSQTQLGNVQISKNILGQSNQTVGLFQPRAFGGGTAIPTLVTGGATPAGLINFQGQNVLNTAAGAALAGLAAQDVTRELQRYVNGPQTPKPVQPALEIWNKLRFWFNDDVRLSIASVSIPFGQRYITIDLEQQANLMFEVPSIYLMSVIDIPAPGVPQDPTVNNTRSITYTPYSLDPRNTQLLPVIARQGISAAVISQTELYINNIFVNPEVHDIYIKRIGFSLIRVYREQVSRRQQSGADSLLLSQLKWPIEYMFVGLRPSFNISTLNPSQWRDWHRMTRMIDSNTNVQQLTELAGAQAAALGSLTTNQVEGNKYYLPVSTIDTLALTSHGIQIFDNYQDLFYNQYMPYNYGGPMVVTPEDTGAMFVNMALFPRSYQPSGHLNISRARETYLQWTSSYVTASTPADLFAIAVAINFLLITDGSAVLRYST